MEDIVYLSGSISGCPDGNRSSFEVAERSLRGMGLEVVNPHVICADLDEDSTQEEYIRVCVKAMLRCTRVVVLEDWERSRGVHSEVIVALKTGIPVQESLSRNCCEETLIPIGVDRLPEILSRLSMLEKEYLLDTLR
jgi:hypothetical protein